MAAQGVGKRISELEYTQSKLPNLNSEEKILMEKQANKASRTCGTITKSLTFLSLESQKEKRKKADLQAYSKNNGGKLIKFGKRHVTKSRKQVNQN